MAEDHTKDESMVVHDPDDKNDKNDKNETEIVDGLPTMGIIAPPPLWGKLLRPKRKKPGKK